MHIILAGGSSFGRVSLRTFSRTSGSSIAARFSRGDRSTCACSGPPTYSTNLPSSSLNAVSTSSSSSTDSVYFVSPHVSLVVCKRKPTVEEGYQLISCALSAQCKSYGVETVNCVQSQDHIVVLELVDEDGNWVELVVLCVHGGL